MSNNKQPAGQLTAEEIFLGSAVFPGSPCSYSIKEITSAMEQYAAQQTAAKDAEIAQLREELANEKYTFMVYRETIDKVLNYHGTEKSESMKKG